MKKTSLLFFGVLWCAGAFPQFLSNKPLASTDTNQGVVAIVIDGIDAATELQYTGAYTTMAWHEYSDGDRFVGNQNYIYPENNTGYRLEVDGKNTYIWVFDYKAYLPQIAVADPALIGESQCDVMQFQLNPAMEYRLPAGGTRTLKRNFSLKYTTKTYADDWTVEERTKEVSFINGVMRLEGEDLSLDPQAVFVFTDVLPLEMGAASVEVRANDEFATVFPVESRLEPVIVERDALNEISRPAAKMDPIKGSAPIEITFESHSSDPDNTLYDWKIYRGGELLLTRTDENLRYTFEAFGTYKVRLEVGNGACAMTDSVEVNVAESFLGVPNVFTPNGDDKNDEFRVAYRSLATFHCWVYNSWGKLVYEWTDPAKGWDGRVNGKKNAPSGTYFYIIKATGTDGEVWNTKGDISIIR